MTWAEIKAEVEKQGVQDDAEVAYIDITGDESIVAVPLPNGWHINSEN